MTAIRTCSLLLFLVSCHPSSEKEKKTDTEHDSEVTDSETGETAMDSETGETETDSVSETGLDDTRDTGDGPPEPNLSIASVRFYEEHVNLGLRAAPSGDVDGDGIVDPLLKLWIYSEGDYRNYYGIFPGSIAAGTAGLEQAMALIGGEGFYDYGYSITGNYIGDPDGDGYGDIMITDPGLDLSGGTAYIYSGESIASSKPQTETVFYPEEGSGSLGYGAVARYGDVNDDGNDDLIIQDRSFRKTSYDEDYGRTYLFYGPPPLKTTVDHADAIFLPVEDKTIEGLESAASASTIMEDLNGDGALEIMFRATERQALILGPVYGEIPIDAADYFIESSESKSGERNHLSATSSLTGDMNGDGYNDILGGGYQLFADSSPGRYTAWVLNGPITRDVNLDEVDAWIIMNNYGFNINSVPGDMNGDGTDDLLIGNPTECPYPYEWEKCSWGSVHVFYSPVSGTINMDDSDRRVWGEEEGDEAGRSVTGVGDWDADGLADFLVGAEWHQTAYLVTAASLMGGM